MKNFLKLTFLLSTCLPIFAAAPYEYSPVFTNMTLLSTVGLANRVTSLVGGGVVTNLYTGSLNGLAGTFIWTPDGPISSVDGIDILDKRILPPAMLAITSQAGGMAAGTYSYRVTALTALGETTTSSEATSFSAANLSLNINWTPVPGATGYRIYGRTNGTTLAFISQVGQVGTFLDTGSVIPSGAMPSTNSTMGVIGTWNRHFIKVFGKSPQSGDLTNDFPNLSLVPVITAGGPIGSATTVPIITYDAKGRLTTVTSTTISGVAPSGAAGGGLSGTYPNPNVNLSATTSILGDLPLSNIVQIATGTLLGRNTAGTGDIEVVTDIATAITIGGAYIYRVGGTDVIAADGGTGRSTLTQDGVLYGSGTGQVGMTAQGAANTVLVANAGAPSFSAAITVGTSVTTPALIATTSLTTPAATISGLTAARFAIVDTGGLIITDSDFTWSTDTASFTKVLAPTSVSSPALISTAAITATPAAGSGFNINLSTTGDFAVNTDDLVVDTSTGNVGIGTTGPVSAARLDVRGANTINDNYGNINVATTDATAIDKGGSLTLGGENGQVTTPYVFGKIAGRAEAANSYAGYLSFATPPVTGLVTERMRITSTGSVGIGTTGPLAKLAINGGGHVGGDSDPGDGNWLVDGNTTTATLTVSTWAQFNYTTASRVAVINASKQLDSSGTTIVELGYLAGVTSAIQTQFAGKTFVPKYNTGDPNFLTLTGDGDGQLYMNTTTGEKWHWYAAGPYWTP